MTMNAAAKRSMTPGQRGVILALGGQLALRFARELTSLANSAPVVAAGNYIQLRELLSRFPPEVLLLDHELLDSVPFLESLHQLTEMAPMVLIAPLSFQSSVARLVAAGNLDFVAREGDFISLAAGLLDRRLRWARGSISALAQLSAGSPCDIGEVFRHEINNPLTGILGNAELLLSHCERLSTVDAQRLRTVVDLAVRLRETIRRVSNAFEPQPRKAKPA